MIKRFFPLLCLSLCSIFGLTGCVTEPSLYTGETKNYGYTWQQELELGRTSDTEITAQMGLYPDDQLANYVRDLGQQILDHSAFRSDSAPELYRGTEFTFRLLDSPVVNAFALPGGYVYVTRGLLAHLENEAQLAVVLGHEITHVEARHASQQALKQQIGQIGLLAGAIIGEQVAENKELAREMVNLSGSLFQLVTLKYGREAERESDFHGVEYASKAGYDAAQGSAFFKSLKRISEKSGQSIPTWMSSHPDPGERETTIRQLSQEWKTNSTGQVVGKERYLDKIEGLIVGENPRHGYFDSGYFYHPNLKFQFAVPSGWKTQNDSSAVYLAEPNGQTVVAFSVANASNPLAAAQAFLQKISMEPTSSQETSINGFPAYRVEGTLVSQSSTLAISASFVQMGDSVFSFLGYGAQGSFPQHKANVLRTANSFDELRNTQALTIQPYRITILPAERTAAFKDLLPQRLPPGMDALDWAIINQVDLDDRIERGTLLKLPNQTN